MSDTVQLIIVGVVVALAIFGLVRNMRCGQSESSCCNCALQKECKKPRKFRKK